MKPHLQKSLEVFDKYLRETPKEEIDRQLNFVYCADCKHERKNPPIMIEPCKLHPYYNRNKENKCKDYERKWWKLWLKSR